VVAAILSSNQDMPLDPGACFAAEVGLSGEIRPVNRIDQRVSEADKLGFQTIIISAYNFKGLEKKFSKLKIVQVKRMEDLYRNLFSF
jgi:DNA repair protein RadA/Sms